MQLQWFTSVQAALYSQKQKLCKILRLIYALNSRQVKQGGMILAGFVHSSWAASNLDLEFNM